MNLDALSRQQGIFPLASQSQSSQKSQVSALAQKIHQAVPSELASVSLHSSSLQGNISRSAMHPEETPPNFMEQNPDRVVDMVKNGHPNGHIEQTSSLYPQDSSDILQIPQEQGLRPSFIQEQVQLQTLLDSIKGGKQLVFSEGDRGVVLAENRSGPYENTRTTWMATNKFLLDFCFLSSTTKTPQERHLMKQMAQEIHDDPWIQEVVSNNLALKPLFEEVKTFVRQ